jgi:hypothetical protein
MKSKRAYFLAIAAVAAFSAAAAASSAAAAAAEASAPPGGSDPGGRSPWFLGLAVSPEGFGGGLGSSGAERLSLAIVLDPFQWKTAVPSLAAGITIPVFPWQPEDALFEARLDLRALTLRSRLFDSPYDGPAEYAPALSASVYLPLAGGEPFGSFGIRPFSFRTGDASYSLLSPGAVFSRGPEPGGSYGFRGYSIELFEFTHFFW